MRPLHSYIRSVEKTDRTWVTACHLSPLAMIVGMIPAANVIAPLIVWIIRKKQSAPSDRHGRAVLNFQLAMTLYFLILYVVSKLTTQWDAISSLEVPAGICLRIWAYTNIFLILRGGYKAAKGDLIKYPFSIRFFPQ